MDVGIGLPSTIRGTTREQTAGVGPACRGARLLQPRDDRPDRLRQLRAADRAGRGRRGDRADQLATRSCSRRPPGGTCWPSRPRRSMRWPAGASCSASRSAGARTTSRRSAPTSTREGGIRRDAAECEQPGREKTFGRRRDRARRPADVDHRRRCRRRLRAHREVRRRLDHGRRHARQAARRRREDARGVEGGRARGRAADHGARLLRAGRRRQGAARGLPRRLLRDSWGTTSSTIVGSAATDAETVRAYVQGFADAGCDELILFPSDPDPGQVDLLADALG